MSYEAQMYDGLEDLAFEAIYGSDYDIDTERLGIWVCKDGREIQIKDMSTTHIINSIAMIQRSIRNGQPWRTEYLPLLQEELDNRQFLVAIRNMSDEEFNKIVHKQK